MKKAPGGPREIPFKKLEVMIKVAEILQKNRTITVDEAGKCVDEVRHPLWCTYS